MKNEVWFKEIISTVKFGSGFPMSKFYYHPLYHVGVGRDTNLDYTFGKKRKLPLKNLRKFKYFTFQAPFPTDAVVFFQPKRKRLLVASQSENKVLKISSVPERIVLLKGEIEKLNHQNNSAFSSHTVKLIDYGPNWLMTTFSSNIDSVAGLDHFSLRDLLIGPLTKFYKSHPLKVLSTKDWLEEARKRAVGHPSIELVTRLIDRISQAQEIELVHGQLHFDLHAGNVLRDGEKIVVIDWELSYPGLLLIDYFDFYRRHANKNKWKGEVAVNKLEGLSFLNDFKKWMREFGINLPDIDGKHLLDIYALERTLIYFDRWKEDRLSDKSGFERNIALA